MEAALDLGLTCVRFKMRQASEGGMVDGYQDLSPSAQERSGCGQNIRSCQHAGGM